MAYEPARDRAAGTHAGRIGRRTGHRFRGNAVRALLAYLAMHAGLTRRREYLAALLWPDELESVALQNLRQTLRRLRTAIGDEAANPPFLGVTRTTLAFAPENDHWLD